MTSSNGNIFCVFCVGNSLITGEFPAQRPVMRTFDVFFDLHLIQQLSKDGDAGNLRRHRAQYDVIVMHIIISKLQVQVCCETGSQALWY